jgi:steroid delta-isomerase-like uncharacterized protein
MSMEDRKAVLRRHWTEAVNGRNLDLVDELFAKDYAYHGAGGAEFVGREYIRDVIQGNFSAFPDFEVQVEQLLADGDRVVTYGKGRGTHEGDFMGIAPTGKTIEAPFITISRFENGRIAEEWELIDIFGLMQQLGALPAE